MRLATRCASPHLKRQSITSQAYHRRASHENLGSSTALLRLILVSVLQPADLLPLNPSRFRGPGAELQSFSRHHLCQRQSFPLGMAELSDGSLLVTVVLNAPVSPAHTNPGRLLRLTDTNNNGIADNAGTILYSNPLAPSPPCGSWIIVFVMGRPTPSPCCVRRDALPVRLTLAGRLLFTYPSLAGPCINTGTARAQNAWLHQSLRRVFPSRRGK